MNRYFALIPAAGSGARMAQPVPKQYLPLLGEPLIAHTVRTLAGIEAIEKIFVVLAPDDTLWAAQCAGLASARVQPLYVGGPSRAQSVAAGLAAMPGELAGELAADDWVLVHDAARACITPAQVQALMHEVGRHLVGGLLAVPVADTLKRANAAGQVVETVPRESLWQAQTPQMFRYGLLMHALAQHPDVTDEATAVEACGHAPQLVASDVTNFKVTRALDLQLAEWVLKHRTAQP